MDNFYEKWFWSHNHVIYHHKNAVKGIPKLSETQGLGQFYMPGLAPKGGPPTLAHVHINRLGAVGNVVVKMRTPPPPPQAAFPALEAQVLILSFMDDLAVFAEVAAGRPVTYDRLICRWGGDNREFGRMMGHSTTP